MNLCKGLKTNTLVKEPNDLKCWILDMDEQQPSNKKLPIADPAEFEQEMRKFAFNTEKGREHVGDFNLGFDKSTGKLIWMRIVVPSVGDPNDSGK